MLIYVFRQQSTTSVVTIGWKFFAHQNLTSNVVFTVWHFNDDRAVFFQSFPQKFFQAHCFIVSCWWIISDHIICRTSHAHKSELFQPRHSQAEIRFRCQQRPNMQKILSFYVEAQTIANVEHCADSWIHLTSFKNLPPFLVPYALHYSLFQLRKWVNNFLPLETFFLPSAFVVNGLACGSTSRLLGVNSDDGKKGQTAWFSQLLLNSGISRTNWMFIYKADCWE